MREWQVLGQTHSRLTLKPDSSPSSGAFPVDLPSPLPPLQPHHCSPPLERKSKTKLTRCSLALSQQAAQAGSRPLAEFWLYSPTVTAPLATPLSRAPLPRKWKTSQTLQFHR